MLAAVDLARVVEAARDCGAAILGGPVVDTLKEVVETRVARDVSRSRLYHAETPQVFRRDLLASAHRQNPQDLAATDDSGLVQQIDEPVMVVVSECPNIKVTTPADLELAEAYLRHLYPAT